MSYDYPISTMVTRARLSGGAGPLRLTFVDAAPTGSLKALPALPPLSYPVIRDIAFPLADTCALIEDILEARQDERGAKQKLVFARYSDGQSSDLDRLARMPDDVLRSIRVRLMALVRKWTALDLVATFLPDRLGKYGPNDDWTCILLDFLDCIQSRDLLPLSASLIEYALEVLDQRTDDEEEGYLEDFLNYIPLELISIHRGFYWDDYDSRNLRPCDLLFALFVNDGAADEAMADRWGLPQDIDPEIIVRGIRQAPPGTFEPGTPLVYLPEAAAIYQQRTGADLVDLPDTVSTDYSDDSSLEFAWNEAPKLMREWRAVRPMVEHKDKLEKWLEDEANARRMVALLLRLAEEVKDDRKPN